MIKKILTYAIIALLIVTVVFAAAKNTIVRVSVEKGAEMVTGLKLKMKSLNVGILNTMVGINGLNLYNPPGFEDKIMLNMPEIYVDYDLPAILGGKVHLKELRVNMQEFMVVKNAKGELNLDALKPVQKEETAAAAKPAEKGKAPEIQIDVFELKVGKVIYKDYSKGGAPSIQEFNVNIDERFENITDPNQLVGVIVAKALMNTTIAKLTNFDLKGLQGSLGDKLGSAQKIVGQATETLTKTTEQATKVLSTTSGTAQETVKTTTETVQKAADNIKGLFGSTEE